MTTPASPDALAKFRAAHPEIITDAEAQVALNRVTDGLSEAEAVESTIGERCAPYGLPELFANGQPVASAPDPAPSIGGETEKEPEPSIASLDGDKIAVGEDAEPSLEAPHENVETQKADAEAQVAADAEKKGGRK